VSALVARASALEVVGVEVGSVPVEARKQSRATLPLSRAAEHHPRVAGALGSVLAQEAVREAETAAETEESQV
jgi:hypothetical protein